MLVLIKLRFILWWMLRWLCITMNLVDFVVWMVRIVTCILRMVHIRKVWCILEDSQLMKLETRIKVELGFRWELETLCELGTHIESSSNFIIFWTHIKVELRTHIKVELRIHIGSSLSILVLRGFYVHHTWFAKREKYTKFMVLHVYQRIDLIL